MSLGQSLTHSQAAGMRTALNLFQGGAGGGRYNSSIAPEYYYSVLLAFGAVIMI